MHHKTTPVSNCSFWSASSLSLLTDTSYLDSPAYFLSDELIIHEDLIGPQMETDLILTAGWQYAY
jgi:hypothetical protein